MKCRLFFSDSYFSFCNREGCWNFCHSAKYLFNHTGHTLFSSNAQNFSTWDTTESSMYKRFWWFILSVMCMEVRLLVRIPNVYALLLMFDEDIVDDDCRKALPGDEPYCGIGLCRGFRHGVISPACTAQRSIRIPPMDKNVPNSSSTHMNYKTIEVRHISELGIIWTISCNEWTYRKYIKQTFRWCDITDLRAHQ